MRDEELHGLLSSPDVVRKIESRMKWAEHVKHVDEKRYAYNGLVEKPQ